MTSWADVVSAAMVQIDDARLMEQLNTSPAQFYRRMSLLVAQALPLLSRPPELLRYLKGGMTVPAYDDFEWVSTKESTAGESVVWTEKTGFDLCSVIIVGADGVGVPFYTPYPGATYDAATGNVTFPRQDRDGIRYMLDFYTDGAFPDLSETQARLFALAVAAVWDERFERNWLNLQPKIKDQSFETVNEANYMDKSGQRLLRNRQRFNDELRKYEQDCSYAAAVAPGSGRVRLI